MAQEKNNLDGCAERLVLYFERVSAHPFRLGAAALIVSPYVLPTRSSSF